MIINDNAAFQVAEILLQINAIKLNLTNPFTWASGWKSPIYCDNRILLSYPKHRERVAQTMSQEIKKLYPEVEIIAGVATGAIGMGMLVAHILQLPFIYIRPEAKKHGRGNQIEGNVEKNNKIVVVEDLVSTAMSSLRAISALKEAETQVLGMISIFSYGFDIAEEAFKKEGMKLQSLSDYNHLIECAIEKKYVDESEKTALVQWRKDPENWRIW